MSDAQLTYLRAERDRIKRQPYSDWGFSYEEDIANAVDEIDRLREAVNSAIVYANCRINGHSDSCNRETWRAMVASLGERVKELADDETYEHPESNS
jgi:hypothetical protein